MNFEESNAKSNYHNSISEDIEYSKTNKLANQSIVDKNKSKKYIKTTAPAQPTVIQ